LSTRVIEIVSDAVGSNVGPERRASSDLDWDVDEQ
jgi:hypothetical protein